MAELNLSRRSGGERNQSGPSDGMEMNAMESGEARHEAGKREVEMYIRTFHTLLRSSGEVGLKALVQAHYNIDSALHPDARSTKPDMSAFIYSVLRLPDAVLNCNRILLGQSEEIFKQQGYEVDTWESVTASARRRKWFYDSKNTDRKSTRLNSSH